MFITNIRGMEGAEGMVTFINFIFDFFLETMFMTNIQGMEGAEGMVNICYFYFVLLLIKSCI